MLVALVLSLVARAQSSPTELLAAYEAIRVPLVEDRLDDARASARALATAPDAADLAGPAGVLAASTDGAEARMAFGELSRALVVRFSAGGAPPGVKVFHCPMTAAWPYWLQASAGIANPYMGAAMPICGEGTSLRVAARAAGEVR